MKKLMIAAVAIAAGVAFAEDIKSANIVGYQNLATDANESPALGATFVPVVGGETYKMGDLKATDFDFDFDMLQILDPNSTAPVKFFSYYSKERADQDAIDAEGKAGDNDALIGWWDIWNGTLGEEEYRMDNESINVGQAFLGAMSSGNDVKLIASGSAPTESTSIFTDSNESPFIANYIPRDDLKMKQISCNNFDFDFDMLQYLDPNSTAPVKFFSYYSKERADQDAIDAEGKAGDNDALIGWWDIWNGTLGEEEYRMDNETVKAGMSFLGAMSSGEDVEIMFPTSTFTAE